MVARGVEHGHLVDVLERPQAVVRSTTTDVDTHVSARDLLLGDTGVLKGLICDFEQLALLRICGRGEGSAKKSV